MEHKQDPSKQDLQQAMAKDFDKLADKDEKTDIVADKVKVEADPAKELERKHAELKKLAEKGLADGKKEAKHPDQVPEMEDRTYPRWYFNRTGAGFLINSAAHHLDYPGYVAESPAAFGIETAPAAPDADNELPTPPDVDVVEPLKTTKEK